MSSHTSAVPPDEVRRLADDLIAAVGHDLTTRLQDIADAVSIEFGHPVSIDDRQMRLLAHTEHPPADVDSVRLMSVMKRQFPQELFDWAHAHGLGSSMEPFRVPANPEFKSYPRACAPITSNDQVLGYLWVIDRDDTMTDGDLERLKLFADDAATVLYREFMLLHLDRRRERELLRAILSEDDGVRRDAAAQLVEFDLFVPSGAVVVLVVPIPQPSTGRSAESVGVAVDAALFRVRRRMAPKHGLHLMRPGHALFVAAVADSSIRRGTATFATQVRDELVSWLADSYPDLRQIVAVGGAAEGLADAGASYRQAQVAAKVAQAVSSVGPVASWEQLGVYQVLAELPLDSRHNDPVHPGLRRLLDEPGQYSLVETLETYLDNAGDVQTTATALVVHRTTLYHRLRRLEKIAGIDLRSGDDRLALHLGLKILRLQGFAPEWDEAPAAAAAD